ncbi:glycosyl transferase [Rickenella mellea]|uniref:Glycosyl transferase n=1 Tax=Rickenella mellea TaxID=50990 RepID=A0A4Y7PZZ1_9AGAM|nr:glycosyl transferase [Rickenella mellea]
MPAGRLGRRFMLFIVVLVAFATFAGYRYDLHKSFIDASHIPSPSGPSRIIPHFHAAGIDFDEKICKLHGWEAREVKDGREVWDALIFDGELDLLEIRMRELDDVVDKWFILESNRTLNGQPKPLHFAEAQYTHRFSRFSDRIVYRSLLGHASSSSSPASQNYFKGNNNHDRHTSNTWEARQRSALTSLIKTRVSNLHRAPLVIMSNVDEIPSAHTISLLRSCVFERSLSGTRDFGNGDIGGNDGYGGKNMIGGGVLHLEMKQYLYSFEWPTGIRSWRAQVHEWGDHTVYTHDLSPHGGGVMLADAGWNCVFCLRRLEDFKAKLLGYSERDPSLSLDSIQMAVCEGKDILKVIPEANSGYCQQYKDFMKKINLKPSMSAVGLPRYLIENADKFGYMLPGGCVRDSDEVML